MYSEQHPKAGQNTQPSSTQRLVEIHNPSNPFKLIKNVQHVKQSWIPMIFANNTYNFKIKILIPTVPV